MRARARTTKLTIIGVAIGIALAGTAAVAPATAAPPASVAERSASSSTTATTATYGCSYFSGRTVTANWVSVSSVGLNAGEVIGVTVSPARVGDEIILSVSSGQSITFLDEPATSGLKFKAASAGTYSFGWSLEAAGTRPSSITWTFTCSSGSGSTIGTTDSDRDGVANTADACASTTLPDVVSRKAAGRYYALSTGRFVDGTGAAAGVTVVDAGGCSATQIAAKLGLKPTDTRSGITLTTLKNWAATH